MLKIVLVRFKVRKPKPLDAPRPQIMPAATDALVTNLPEPYWLGTRETQQEALDASILDAADVADRLFIPLDN